MEKKIRAVTGTQDLIGEDLQKRLKISDVFSKTMKKFNVEPVETPILELLEVFEKNLGETSDIVQKEMFTLESSGETLVLRPEGTAGLLRAVIDRGWEQKLPLKVSYDGPMFRKETPQKGRFRQFDQVGLELLGYKAQTGDTLSIMAAYAFLSNLKVKNLKLEINYLGSDEERANYKTALMDYLTKEQSKLSKESKERLQKNPLRILDSKQKEDQDVVKNAPTLKSFLGQESLDTVNLLIESLNKMNIPFEYNPKLVRGLDYYTGLVFEFVSEEIGAQSTVLAGGRYDKLSTQMGGSSIPAIGWAAGKERLSYLVELDKVEQNLVGIVTTEDSCIPYAYEMAKTVTEKTKYSVEIPSNDSIAKKMKKLNKMNAQYVIVVGPDEVKNNVYSLKNMETGEQEVLDKNVLLMKILVSSLRS